MVEDERKEAKEAGLNPVEAVDYPLMGLQLKQGCGRLIRKEDDKGIIVLLAPFEGAPWEKYVKGALPEGAKLESFETFM